MSISVTLITKKILFLPGHWGAAPPPLCTLVFLLTNIRGGFASKLDEFQVLFNDSNIYISVLTETWLNSDINFDMLHNPGYRMFRLDSHDGRQQ